MKKFYSIHPLALVLSSLLIMNFQCMDCADELYDNSSYSVTINPNLSTFSIGDTLILNTNLNSQILLENSGIIHDNSNLPISYSMLVFEGVNNDSTVISAIDNFDYISLDGNVTLPNFNTWKVNISNSCNNNSCNLEFGLVPQRSGYFGLLLETGDIGNNYNCQNLSLIPIGINSSGGNNFEIFSEIDINSIRINSSFWSNPESENLMYFFKITE